MSFSTHHFRILIVKILPLCLILSFLLLAFKTQAQESERPLISKKEVRKLDKQLKKFNKLISKQLEELKGEIPVSDSVQVEEPVPDLDSLRESLVAEINGVELPESSLDTLNIYSQMQQEIDELKGRMKVSMQMARGNPELLDDMNSSLIEMAKLDYSLEEFQKLSESIDFSQLSADLKQQFEGLEGYFSEMQGQLDEYSQLLKQYKEDLINWDKTLENRINRLEAVQGIQESQSEMLDFESGISEAQQQVEGIQSKEIVTQRLQKRFSKILEEEGKDALAKRLSEGHAKLKEYKEVFNEVNDISKPPKKNPNPYEGKPLKDRLSVGGNFQINRTDPVTVDASGEIAYLLSQKAEWGVGSAYRIAFGKNNSLSSIATDVWNVKTFYFHELIKNAGVQLNYEMNNAQPPMGANTEIPQRTWTQSGLAGFRFNQKILGRFKAYNTIQYDFLHSTESPGPKWVFRFGIRLN